MNKHQTRIGSKMSEIVSLELRDSIALIKVNNPPVNALSYLVRKGLIDCITQADENTKVKAIVLYCLGRTYFAGADITEFGKPMQSPSLPEALSFIDTVSKPIITALHGTALGGGLEVALTCHYRVANSSTKVGLPEVHLGLLPGAGGTQRLPRLIGVEKALDVIVSGRQVKAAEALSLGIIDKIIEGDVVDGALKFAHDVVEQNLPVKRISEITVDKSLVAEDLINNYRKKIAKKFRGFEAPQACISAVEASIDLPFLKGVEKERSLFLECMKSTQSASQRHMFFAQRQAAVIDDLDKKTPTREINNVAIIGAGTMGSGIALSFSNANIPVTLLEVNENVLQSGLNTIEKYYRGQAAKGRMTNEKAAYQQGLITGTLSYDDLSDVDLVIEAVFESMEVKHQVFSKLDEVCKPGCILASNTSTLDVDEIASITKRPQDVIGLHFFSPAQVMKLLEVIRAEKTADDVLATAMKLGSKIGKIPVVSGVCDGFIGNRMLKGYGREAGALLLEGATPAQIDNAVYQFGMAMGPMTMADLSGLDIGYRVRKERRESGVFVPETDGAISDRLVENGRLGQKNRKGYYRYEENSYIPIPDEEVNKIIKETAQKLGFEQREISDEEIVKRLIYPLINEGAQILDEGIAQRASDVNAVWVYGYGFPVYRGGPMFYADSIGLENILNDLKLYQEKYGDIWQPAPLLEKLVNEGKRFSDI